MIKKFSLRFIALAIITTIAGCSTLSPDNKDTETMTGTVVDSISKQDQVDDNQDQNKEEKLISDPSLGYLNLPAGFVITTYAQVPNARSLEIVETDNQIVTFVGNRTASSVYALIDTDKDYSVDETIEIARGLNSPNGVAYEDGDLYVAEISRIIRFKDILNNLENPTFEVFFDDLAADENHGWKYIAFGPDERLYIPIGAPCNICDAGAPYASLYALDLQTKELELLAEGIRNTVGFDRHPTTQELWFTDNGRDRMGDDIPVDELNVITQKSRQHFGFPYCHQGDIQDPQFNNKPCSEFIPPQTKLGPHVAALGMMFTQAIDTDPKWKNHVLIAEHGSWNRTIPLGYRISAVDLETNEYSIFIDGWLQGTQVRGRPVDIKVFPDGSLLISDDYAGLLYRVQWQQPE